MTKPWSTQPVRRLLCILGFHRDRDRFSMVNPHDYGMAGDGFIQRESVCAGCARTITWTQHD